MTEREKVVKCLEKCRRCECDDCTEKDASKAPFDCPAYDDFVDSAIVLLKEQETASLYKSQNCGTWVSAKNVIFCKDCQFYNEGENEVDSWMRCRLHSINTLPDWFCSLAVKK